MIYRVTAWFWFVCVWGGGGGDACVRALCAVLCCVSVCVREKDGQTDRQTDRQRKRKRQTDRLDSLESTSVYTS